MSLRRRDFLLTSVAATAAVAAARPAGAATLPDPKHKASLRLSSQLSRIPGNSLEEKMAKMKKWGFEAAELPSDIVGNEKAFEDAFRNTGMIPSAVCWGAANGLLVSPSPEKRKEGQDMLKAVLKSAGQLKTTGVIHVPAFHKQSDLSSWEIRKIVLDTYPELGAYAVECGSRIILEPLNRKETFCIRQVADAASICRDCNSPGIAAMGDFYHMFFEETSDLGAFISGGDYIRHVHLASRTRVLPGQDDRQRREQHVGGDVGHADAVQFAERDPGFAQGRDEIADERSGGGHGGSPPVRADWSDQQLPSA